jgi:hypothetical protein
LQERPCYSLLPFFCRLIDSLCASVGSSSDDQWVDSDIRRLNDEEVQAFVHNDSKRIAQLWPDDLVVTVNGKDSLSYRRGYFVEDPSTGMAASQKQKTNPLLQLMGRNLPDYSQVLFKIW